MNTGKIEVTDLSDWRAYKTVEYASAIKGGNHLQLLATLNGSFEVVLNGNVICSQIQPYPITEFYNKELEKL